MNDYRQKRVLPLRGTKIEKEYHVLIATGRWPVRLVGEVAERLKAHAWKACVGLPLPRVRIPPSPPLLAAGELAIAY